MSREQLLDYYKNNYYLQPFAPVGKNIMADDPIGWWGEVGTVLKYQYSPVYNYLSTIGKYEEDPEFHPEDHINFLTEDPSYLMSAGSMEELMDMRKNFTHQQQIKQDMEQVRWHAGLAGGIADPLTWIIPAGVFFKGAKTVWGGVKAGLMSGGAYSVASETIRAPFDPTNTVAESALNMGAMTAFGGAIGGAMRIPSAIRNLKSGQAKVHKVIEDQKNSILNHKVPRFNIPEKQIEIGTDTIDIKQGVAKPRINRIAISGGEEESKTSSGVLSSIFFKQHSDLQMEQQYKTIKIKIDAKNIALKRLKVQENQWIEKAKLSKKVGSKFGKRLPEKVKVRKRLLAFQPLELGKIAKIKERRLGLQKELSNLRQDRVAFESEIRRRQSPFKLRPKYKNYYLQESTDPSTGKTVKTLYIDIKSIKAQFIDKPYLKIKNLIDLDKNVLVARFGKRYNVSDIISSTDTVKLPIFKGFKESRAGWTGLHVYEESGKKGIVLINNKKVGAYYDSFYKMTRSKRILEGAIEKTHRGMNDAILAMSKGVGQQAEKIYTSLSHRLFFLENFKQFNSKADFFDFVILHEMNHGKYRRRPKENISAYEKRIDKLAMKDFKQFKNAGITGGEKVKNAKQSLEEVFETEDDWARFNYHKIIDRISNPQETMKAYDRIQYEDWINRRALDKIERFKMRHGPKKQYNVSELDGSNRMLDLMNTPLKTALKFIAGNGAEVPDHIKGYFVRLAKDAGLILNQDVAGQSQSSVMLSIQSHWEKFGDVTYVLQNLHYQQAQGLSKINPDIKTKRNILLGYRGGKSFQEFLNKATINYIMRGAEQVKKSKPNLTGAIKDINWDGTGKEIFGENNKLTVFEKKASDEIEKFFKTYEMEANEAGLFSIDKSISQTEFWLNTILPERLERAEKRRLHPLIDLEKMKRWKSSKSTDNLILQKTRDIKDIDESIASTKASIGGNKKRLEMLRETKAKNFSPLYPDNYFSRVFDKVYIQRNREQFTRLIQAWFKEKPYRILFDNETGIARRKNYSSDPTKIRERAEKFVRQLLEEESIEDLDDALVPLSTGFLNSRNLDAPNYWQYKDRSTNETIRMIDFLITDPLEVMKNYVIRVAPKIEFKREFNVPVHRLVNEIDDELRMEGFTPKESSKIKASFMTLYERISGQRIKNPMRWDNVMANNMRWLSQITYLGGAGQSSLADMPNMYFQFGARPFQVALEHLVDIPTMQKAIHFNRNSGEGHLETLKGMVSNRFVDSMMMNPASRGFTKFKERSLNAFYTLNFLRPLTMFFKEIVGLFGQDDIIRHSLKWDSLDDFKKIEMSRYFVGEKEAKLLAKMNHQTNSNGSVYYANMDNWKEFIGKNGITANDVEEARKIMSRAMASRMNTGVLTATASDKFQMMDGVMYAPYKSWMRKLGWKPDELVSTRGNMVVRLESGLMALPFQFWNYGLAASQKILNAGFDPTRPVSNRIFGATMMIGIGYMIARWRLPDNMWDKMSADERLMRAVHLSGVTGMYSDYTFMATAMYHGFTGAERDKSIVKPLYNPSTFDSIMEPFGASIGMVGDISRGTYTMATDSVPHGLAKMPLPLQYIPFWREDVRQMKMWLRNQ